jgi:hypothetical protein
LIPPGASTVIPPTGTAGIEPIVGYAIKLFLDFDLHNYFLSVIIDSHAPGIGGRGSDEGDIVQEGGRHAAISKALNNRNAAGPRGLKPAASFQGLSPIGSGRGAVDHPGVVHPVLPPAVGSGNGRVSQVPGGTLMIIRHTPPTPA